ncbi:hypothetical protein Pmani_034349 [Petrolisthes manimaculis]|uniref:FERM domain-containing protein n=1 Tax=Petrolisthes manimaculis TaxID=1843537 RepID=A0AAE1NMW9_9EUCA|nr:hypothetical protein Pmani_034349 [Petrolisthes manimaculis]
MEWKRDKRKDEKSKAGREKVEVGERSIYKDRRRQLEKRGIKQRVTVRYQFFLQVKQDILQGRLPISQELAAELGSYAVQWRFGKSLWRNGRGERQKSVSEEGAVGGAVVAGRDEDEPATEGMVVNTQLAGAWSPSLARTSGYRQQSPAALSVRPNPLMKTRSSTKK